MNPLLYGSSYSEAVRRDSSPPRKRLKIRNPLNLPVDHKPRGLDQQRILHVASDSCVSSEDHNNSLETRTSTPRLCKDSLEDVCYGMLHNIDIQLKWLPKGGPGPATRFGNHLLIPAKLDFDPDLDVTFVRTEDGQRIGVTSFATSRGLKQVKEHCSIRLQIWTQETSWVTSAEKLADQNRKGEKAVRLQMDILVFGNNSKGQDVAKDLSSCGLYLQDPYHGLTNSLYINPQSLSFLTIQKTFYKSLKADPVPEHRPGEEQDSNMPLYTDEIGKTHLLQMLDSSFAEVRTHDYLTGRPSDSHILTKLYSHQKTALDFVRRRELGAAPLERSLWQPCGVSGSDSFFQHAITGARCASNPDTLGGILADEKGLGKTLSILSAVSDSMGDARSFANSGGQNNVISTLIIVPSELLLYTWTREISRHIRPGVVDCLTYHGHGRQDHDATIGRYHLVLTTYSTVMADKARRGALFSQNWYRVVLDEAHVIRNPSSKQFQAVASLSSQLRWCVTGTPIQNSLKDLESLVRFLRVPVLDKSSEFHKYIIKNRLQRHSNNISLENAKRLLGSISLRRTMSDVNRCQPIYINHQLVFTHRERMQYKDLEVSYKRLKHLAAKTKSRSSDGRVMHAFLRLRMFCNNGLNEQSNDTRPGHPVSRADETLSILQQANEAICAYCKSPVDSASRLPDEDLCFLTVCLRLVCPTCMPEHRKAQEDTRSGSCPLCGQKHSFQEQNLESELQTGRGRNELPTKIVMLVEDVYKHYLHSKCVVFSFWKQSLDIVSSALTEMGIHHLRVDGDITARRRNRALKDFQIRSDLKVLLMTFSTGANGLTHLTVANRIYILEPQSKPIVEVQAIGCVVRLGLEEEVTVTRYAMAQSIEELMQAKQHSKLKVGQGWFRGG